MSTGWLALLSEYAKTYWFVSLLISVFLGGLLPKYVTSYLYGLVEQIEKEPDDRPITELPGRLAELTGYLERLLVTVVVMWLPASAGALIMGWLVLKMAGGWGALKTGTTRVRASYAVALVGSLLSVLWALGWGLLASPWWPGKIIVS
jgi:hypothetical protein